jgi:Arc/MetJ family transcription regulator
MDARRQLDGIDDDALCAAVRRLGELDEHRSVAHAMIDVTNEALRGTPPARVA